MYEQTFTHHGLTVKIERDEFPQNPRTDCDNFGTMICFHKRYILGDKHSYTEPQEFLETLVELIDPDFPEHWDTTMYNRICGQGNWEAEQYKTDVTHWKARRQAALWKILDRHYVILPLYILDHSGYTISTTPFNDPWDSGRLGYVYVSKADVRKEFNLPRLSRHTCGKARKILRQETEVYDAYLTGQVYSYTIEDEEGTHLDSCGGYYCTDQASDEYLLKEAKTAAEYNAQELVKERAHTFATTHTVINGDATL